MGIAYVINNLYLCSRKSGIALAKGYQYAEKERFKVLPPAGRSDLEKGLDCISLF